MANFGSKNETFAYLVGKDIAEIKAKIENIGTTSGGLDVLKVIVPAVTEEELYSGVMAIANLPDEFKHSLVILENYGSYTYKTTGDTIEFYANTIEKEFFIVKLADFNNPKKTVHAAIQKSGSSDVASDS